jgi:hypothetical protein
MPIPVKFGLVTGVTFTVLLAVYEGAVRRTWVGALLGGRRPGPAAVELPTVVITDRLPAPADGPSTGPVSGRSPARPAPTWLR